MQENDLIKFIDNHNFMVIATYGDQWPQAATVEYGNDDLTLIIDTNAKSRKYKNILKNPHVSIVIGWNEQENITVQYQGFAHILKDEEALPFKQKYFQKSPGAKAWETSNEYIKIIPQWIRCTNLNTSPWTIEEFKY